MFYVISAQLAGLFRGLEYAATRGKARSNTRSQSPNYSGPYRPGSMPTSLSLSFTGGYRTTGASSATPQQTAARIVPLGESPSTTLKLSSTSTSSVSKEIEKPVLRQVHVSGPSRVQISSDSTSSQSSDPSRNIQVVSLPSRNQNDHYYADPWEMDLNSLDREMSSLGGLFGGGWGGLFGLGGGLGGGLRGAGVDPLGGGLGVGLGAGLGRGLGGGLRAGIGAGIGAGWDARSDFMGDRWDMASDRLDGRFDARSDLVDSRFDYMGDRADSYGDYASDMYDNLSDRYDYS